MNTEVLERHFEKMGARVKVAEGRGIREWMRRPYTVDIGQDRDGEFFFLRLNEPQHQHAEVLHVDKPSHHLVLMIEDRREKAKFLCGHDERHWFVAALPEKVAVSTVHQAKEALKPEDHRVKLGKFRRQGEWFFIPAPELRLPKKAATLHDEPLVRRTADGRGGKPHLATECYRTGGTEVMVHRRFAPQGFTEEEFKRWSFTNPKEFAKRGAEFTRMTRNATVFVRGEVRHPDHATLKLGTIWHEVKQNRENESMAMASMVFLD